MIKSCNNCGGIYGDESFAGTPCECGEEHDPQKLIRQRLVESNAALKLVYKFGFHSDSEAIGEIIDKNNQVLQEL